MIARLHSSTRSAQSGQAWRWLRYNDVGWEGDRLVGREWLITR